MAGFQVWADAVGNLHVQAGVVIDPLSGVRIAVGSDDGQRGIFPDSSGGEFVAVQPAGGTICVGGNGRNLIATGLPFVASGPDLPVGIYLPNEPGVYRIGIFTLTVSGASAAEIDDGTDVVAILTTGGTAPVGDYVATTYGEDTYNGGDAFTLDLAEESATHIAIPDAAMAISEGTAPAGTLEAVDAANWELVADTDWTIALAVDGTAELRYLTDVMAERSAGTGWNPAGIYEATALGMATYNLTTEEPVDGEAWQAIVANQARRPRAGYVYLEIVEVAGELSAVNGPSFGTLPTATAGTYYVPLAISDGLGGIEQLHTGALIWHAMQPITSAAYADDAAAATGGVPLNGIYRQTGGAVLWRQA